MPTPAPVLLKPDNFTPPTRTPWGGRRICDHYKAGLLTGPPGQVGESWEISVEPDFPARVEPDGEPLAEQLARDPRQWLGEERTRGRTGTALLVKLLDAATPLSVQIHPDDDYTGLAPGEAGKPEAWYVLEAAAEAVLYLGFAEGVDATAVRAALRAADGSMARLLRPVPVAPGDFFVIDAGTPHAIGAGLTLVEPQHVVPGRRGVTYRYWDWDRRYDAQGRPDPAGEPRALHVDHALAVTDWARACRPDFPERIRFRAGPAAPEGPARQRLLCGPGGEAGVGNDYLQVWRLDGTGSCPLPDGDRLRGITLVGGRARLAWPGGTLELERGRSAVVPAALQQVQMELQGGHALVCAVV